MGLIKKSHELKLTTSIKMMIYGQSGMGKTTYALSAPKPLLLDFDGGVGRINRLHLEGVDTVQVSSWGEVIQVLQEDLREYQTIVVDTVGKMMDYIIAYKCGQKQPSIKDWGAINQEFSTFTRNLSQLNKHIIYVAHRDTRKGAGDDIEYIPALREKSYNAIVAELDLLGYMETRAEHGLVHRTITFDPTPRNDGKNACNLPSVMQISELINKQGESLRDNNAIEEYVLKPYQRMIAEKRADAEHYLQVMQELTEAIELITDDVSANDFVSRIDAFEHIGNSKAKASQMLASKAKELKLIFNKDTKRYESESAA